MSSRIVAAAISAVALMLAGTVSAGTLNVKTGLWKSTTTTVRNGQSRPPHTDTRCVTQKDLDDISDTFSKMQKSNDQCKRSDFKETKNSLHWKYECTGQFQIVSIGDLNFTSSSRYKGKVVTKGNIMGHEINSETNMTGERIGACTGKEAGAQP